MGWGWGVVQLSQSSGCKSRTGDPDPSRIPPTAIRQEGPAPCLGDPDLRTGEEENWPGSLLQAVLGELAEAVLESMPRY